MSEMIRYLKIKFRNLILDQKFSEILKGSVWAISARFFTMILGFAFSIIVARHYGPNLVGSLAFINSFLMMTTLFTLFGTPTSILRLIPEHLAKNSASSAFYVYQKTQFLIIGISFGTALFFYLNANFIAEKVLSKPYLSFYIALSSFFIIFQSLMSLNTQAIRGMKLIRLFAFMQILPQSLSMLFLIFTSTFWNRTDIPIFSYLFGFTMTGIVGLFLVRYVFKKKMGQNDTVSKISVPHILSISFPMFLAGIMNFIIAESGIVILSVFRSVAEVGYYAIAVKLSNMTLFILNAIDTMAGPKFSELFHSNKIDDLFHIARKSSKLIFFVTVPLIVTFLLLGKPILIIAFGEKFGSAYPALVILALGQFINAVSGSTGMFMNMTGNQKALKNIAIMTACINILVSFWLIPLWGITGAAVATTVSLCFSNCTVLAFLKFKFGKTTGYFPFINRIG